jgi:2-deoxy-D-gluconate 3-dehydrogenase
VTSVIQRFKRIDILVNNAAIDPKFDPNSHQSNSGKFEEFPLGIWQKALAVNLTGAMLTCKAVSKPMLENGEGVIVNISSMYGIVGPDQRLYEKEGESPKYKPVYYSVTKAGIIGLTRYLATYFAGRNIRVNALTPGGVFKDHDDDFLSKYSARVILGRMAEKDEMNGALLFLVSDASKYMTGANLVVDGGWTAW